MPSTLYGTNASIDAAFTTTTTTTTSSSSSSSSSQGVVLCYARASNVLVPSIDPSIHPLLAPSKTPTWPCQQLPSMLRSCCLLSHRTSTPPSHPKPAQSIKFPRPPPRLSRTPPLLFSSPPFPLPPSPPMLDPHDHTHLTSPCEDWPSDRQISRLSGSEVRPVDTAKTILLLPSHPR